MPEWLYQLLSACAGAGAVYGAIRADLAEIRVKAEAAVIAADKAHSRIDNMHNTRGAR